MRDRGNEVGKRGAPHMRDKGARRAGVRAHRPQLDEAAAAPPRRRLDQERNEIARRDDAPLSRRHRREQVPQEADAHAARAVPRLALGGEPAAARDVDKGRIDYDGRGLGGVLGCGSNGGVERLLALEAVPRREAPLLGVWVAALRTRRSFADGEAICRCIHERRLLGFQTWFGLAGLGRALRPMLDDGPPGVLLHLRTCSGG